MNWYWHRAGGHTHVRVFMNGAKCGALCFRNEEFQAIREHYALLPANAWLIQFIEEPHER